MPVLRTSWTSWMPSCRKQPQVHELLMLMLAEYQEVGAFLTHLGLGLTGWAPGAVALCCLRDLGAPSAGEV